MPRDALPLPPHDERARLRSMLTRPLPELPPIYFYDDRGSELFEAITRLEAYYPTRTELGILERSAAALVAEARPRRVVELGSGAGRKIRLLLDAWRAQPPLGGPRTCTMLDVNDLFLQQSVRSLAADYPEIEVDGVLGDFTTDLARLGPGGDRLTVFFAGTVGNLYPDERRAFFRAIAQGMEASDTLLLGVDLVKDVARLEAAYDDPEGVTAEFNRNALRVVNARFGADFAPDAFDHVAFFDRDHAWIELRLRASRAMRVRIPAIELDLDLAAGAEIRTEVSCKFTRASVEAAALEAGLGVDGWFTDPEQLFALALIRRRAA